MRDIRAPRREPGRNREEMSGCSSGVEHHLAKVRVVRSNRITRSISSPKNLLYFKWFSAISRISSCVTLPRRGLHQ